jgi:hypothetical protein
MPRPRKALDHRRDRRIDDDAFRLDAAHDARGAAHTARAEQGVTRLLEVADRRRESPGSHAGTQSAHPCERELDLDAALRPHQLVPLVGDDDAQVAKEQRCVGARQHQRQALRCRDESSGQPLSLPCARCG